MQEHIDGFAGPIEVTQFATGQSNPTYRLSTPGQITCCGANPTVTLKSAHAVDREFRVMQALAKTDVPVLRVHALCDDDSVIGTMFFVMDLCLAGAHGPGLPHPQPSRHAMPRWLKWRVCWQHCMPLTQTT